MKDKKNFYIDGKWQAPKSKQQIEVVNPSTEEKCAIITLGNKEDVDIAVNSAKEAYDSWAFSTKDGTSRYCRPTQRLIADLLLTTFNTAFVRSSSESYQAFS